MKTHTIAIAALVCSPLIHADETSRLKLANEVIAATKMEKMLDGMKDMMQKSAIEQSKMLLKESEEANSAEFEALQKEIIEVSLNETKIMLKSLGKVYADTFTEEELQGMKSFYESKAGKAMIEKQPILMQKMMPLISTMQMNLKPKMDAIIKKYSEARKKPQTTSSKPTPKS